MMTILKMTICQWGYSLLLLPVIFWANSVQAAPNITCTANMNNINLGVITPQNADNANITGNLSYTCRNDGDTTGYASVCLAAGGTDSATINPRYMTGPNGSTLAFNMALSSNEVWGSRLLSGKEYQSGVITIAAQSSFSDSIPIYTYLLSGHGNIKAGQGIYTKSFDGQHTALTVDTSTDPQAPDCSVVTQSSAQLLFNVKATVDSSCYISDTSDISLGSRSAGTPIEDSNQNAIEVTCIKNTPYHIGLSPSNKNINGAGVLTGSSDSSSTIDYQLRSAPGPDGQKWGNTATADNMGNGVSGKGRGVPYSHTVYVTVPETDVRPDTYSDIVSVTIHY